MQTIKTEKEIYIQIDPYFSGIDFWGIGGLYDKFNVKPKETYIVNDDGTIMKLERPQIMGELYFIVLKHLPSSKFSARSAGTLNLSNVPSKNTRNYNTFAT